jgi:hypothetical protein
MAMRMERSGELIMVYGNDDEPDAQEEWSTRRRKLGALVLAIVAVTAAVFIAPHVPGYEILSNACKAVVAAIW